MNDPALLGPGSFAFRRVVGPEQQVDMFIMMPLGGLGSSIYTQRFNRTHGLDGQLFRGRFKSDLRDGDSYLLQLVRYIHRNPIRAGFGFLFR